MFRPILGCIVKETGVSLFAFGFFSTCKVFKAEVVKADSGYCAMGLRNVKTLLPFVRVLIVQITGPQEEFPCGLMN